MNDTAHDNSPYAPPSAPLETPDGFDAFLHRLLRQLLVIWWLGIPIATTFALVSESWLPPPLLDWVEGRMNAPLTETDMVMAAVITLVILTLLGATVGLWFRKAWAPKVFTVALLFTYLSSPAGGPYVEHGVASLADLFFLVDGAILLVLYLQSRFGASDA